MGKQNREGPVVTEVWVRQIGQIDGVEDVIWMYLNHRDTILQTLQPKHNDKLENVPIKEADWV